MDDQDTQQAPPTPYARPQQPTDSPAASLPTETLTQILDLALQDLKPLERQNIRLVFSSVCKHWWSVAPKTDELVVPGSKQAERLSTALLNEDFAFRQEAIRALVICVGNESSTKASNLIGDLLLSCSFLRRLHLTLSKGFSGDYGILGKGLRNALASCDTLIELEMYGKVEMGGTSFEHSWDNLAPAAAESLKPNLEHLEMPNESSRGWTDKQLAGIEEAADKAGVEFKLLQIVQSQFAFSFEFRWPESLLENEILRWRQKPI